jgi:hypothetical protein
VFGALGQLEVAVDRALAEKDFETALKIVGATVRWACRVTVKDRLMCHGSPRLEALCAGIADNLAADGVAPIAYAPKRGTDVYIASLLMPAGGHTAVIGDFIRLDPKRRSVVLITDFTGQQADLPDEIVERLFVERDRIEICPVPELAGKYRWLVERLGALRPKRTYLFHHMQDSVVGALMHAAAGGEWYFVHHSDRLPSLGAYCRHVVHIDLTPYCFRHCASRLGRTGGAAIDQRYVPLTAADLGARDFQSRKFMPPLTTASSGAPHKFDAGYRPAYMDVVADLLALTGGRHVHIGPLDDNQLGAFRRRLKRRGLDRDRLCVVPFVPSVWQAMTDYDIDLYLNSFPLGGARTLVEVMGSGTPMLWHEVGNPAPFQVSGLQYPQAPVWRSPAELFEIVSMIDGDWLSAQSAAVRARFDAVHGPQAVASKLHGGPAPIGDLDLSEDARPRRAVTFDDLLARRAGFMRRLAGAVASWGLRN